MFTRFQQIDSVHRLREYVNSIICDQYQLQLGAFELTERILIRGGRPCGIYFCLHGPRMTKFSAIWDSEQNQILFYGSRGERFQKTQLTEAPRLEAAAA